MPPDLNLRAPENRLAYFLLLAPVCGDAALVRMEAEEKMIRLNIKARAETIERFYEIADRSRWVLGEPASPSGNS